MQFLHKRDVHYRWIFSRKYVGLYTLFHWKQGSEWHFIWRFRKKVFIGGKTLYICLKKCTVYRWENTIYLVKNSTFCGEKSWGGHLLDGGHLSQKYGRHDSVYFHSSGLVTWVQFCQPDLHFFFFANRWNEHQNPAEDGGFTHNVSLLHKP